MRELEELFEQGAGLIKKTREGVIGSVGKIVAALTLLAVGIVIFTEVSFTKISAEAFTCELAALLLGAVITYFAMEGEGERLALESEEGEACTALLRERIERIRGEDLSALSEFCDRYSKEESIRQKERYLIGHGLSIEDLHAYENGGTYKKKAVRPLRIAHRLRPILITPSFLLSELNSSGHESRMLGKGRRFYLLLHLFPSILCMALTVSIAIHTKGALNAATIAAGVLKIATLLGISARGYLQGYIYGKEALIPRSREKARLLDAFLAENGK